MIRAVIPVLALILALALALLPAGVRNAAANSMTFDAMVIEVKDGDTLTVLRNRSRMTVKLPGIDAPELDQPFGLDAKRFAAKLVRGKVVTIQMSRPGNPIYGAVRFSRDRILALEMVKAGMAWATTTDKTSLFSEAQEAAKSARLGLWVNSEDEDPVPPWEWRAKKRIKK
ncbi:MAG TPA: thermonuclease family protein [Nitrospiraceae bacterium]|jgi:endonuclease YncB( thermonuclease family)